MFRAPSERRVGVRELGAYPIDLLLMRSAWPIGNVCGNPKAIPNAGCCYLDVPTPPVVHWIITGYALQNN